MEILGAIILYTIILVVITFGLICFLRTPYMYVKQMIKYIEEEKITFYRNQLLKKVRNIHPQPKLDEICKKAVGKPVYRIGNKEEFQKVIDIIEEGLS